MKFIRSLEISGLLSFPPDTPPFELHDLNVLIGPNGSGKTNILEALELLRATPTDFAAAIRDGGGATEWFWKGSPVSKVAKIEIETSGHPTSMRNLHERPLRYRLEFGLAKTRIEVLDEAIEEAEPQTGHDKPYFYYRFEQGRPVINVRNEAAPGHRGKSTRHLQRQDLLPDQSVLAQIRDMDRYPEITRLGRQFGQIQMLRDWTFGRYTEVRNPQRIDLPDDRLFDNCHNLALVLHKLERNQKIWSEFNKMLKRFFPRVERMSTGISGGGLQIYLREMNFPSEVSATRLSDGTIRFVALLATLLMPSPPPLICIDEPELGLHPDAVSLIADLMIEASERTQLIVATHSDALVSALSAKPEAVIACERVGAGTTMRRLDSAKLAHWLEEYALGDLWRMGELGANP